MPLSHKSRVCSAARMVSRGVGNFVSKVEGLTAGRKGASAANAIRLRCRWVQLIGRSPFWTLVTCRKQSPGGGVPHSVMLWGTQASTTLMELGTTPCLPKLLVVV